METGSGASLVVDERVRAKLALEWWRQQRHIQQSNRCQMSRPTRGL